MTEEDAQAVNAGWRRGEKDIGEQEKEEETELLVKERKTIRNLLEALLH